MSELRWSSPPALTIDESATYRAVLETTAGSITIELFAKQAPATVNNFVFLAREGFYAGCEFFRVIAPFMVQTGDPSNNGTGGPGYRFADELPAPYPYAPGMVAMANAGPDTNGSQFFICTGSASAGLDRSPNYTQFGRVLEGMEALAAIAQTPVTLNPATGERSRPLEPARILSVTVSQEGGPQAS